MSLLEPWIQRGGTALRGSVVPNDIRMWTSACLERLRRFQDSFPSSLEAGQRTYVGENISKIFRSRLIESLSPAGVDFIHSWLPPAGTNRSPIHSSAGKAAMFRGQRHQRTESLLTTATQILWAERGTPSSTVYAKGLTDPATTNPTITFTPEYQPTYLHIQGNAYFWMSGDYQAGEPSYVYTRSLTATATDPGTRIMTVSQGTNGAVLAFQVSTDALYWVTSTAGSGTA